EGTAPDGRGHEDLAGADSAPVATVVTVREAEPIAAPLTHLDEVGEQVIVLLRPAIAVEGGNFGRCEYTGYQPEIVQRSAPGVARSAVIETAPDTQATTG